MKLEIPYGRGRAEVEVEQSRVVAVVEPNVVPVDDEVETIRMGVEQPVGFESLEEFIADARDLLFIVNDHTRPTPTARILQAIYPKIKGKDARFLIATGIHRAPNAEELRVIFGDHLDVLKDRIHVHDARKDEDMTYLGVSSTGTEMYVNRLGVETHKLVTIGSVEPHYFAGYTGGRKSFLPGIASYRTIEQNHRHALSLRAQALVLKGNPVHEDMVDALKTIAGKEIFSIQTVLDGEKRVYYCGSGDIHASFLMAIDRAHEVYCVDVKEKADIVVAVAGYPSDVDLYQSQKALDNGKLALKEGGILILVSECRSGIGEEAYFQLLAGSDTPRDALSKIGRGYRLGYHKAAKMAEIATWAEVWGVTGLEDKDSDHAFIRPFHDVQQALDKAIETKGEAARILFLMDASLTVPKVT
ncbi:MAG: nickel-dependent lactate racemase [Dehalococcoidia bacterium]|nr:nickel-dependent lactate racemase [Dehalococcoidia bacterium]